MRDMVNALKTFASLLLIDRTMTSVGTHPRRAALHAALAQAFGLLVAFGALKALALWQRGEVPSPGFLAAWAACVAADAWVAAAYGALVAGLLAAMPRPWARRLGLGTWIAFVLVVLYTALNLAFFHFFATPLCRSLVAMTGGAFDLGSSIGSLLTPVFLVSVAGVTFGHRFASIGDIATAQSDIEAAVAFVRRNAPDFHLDPDRLALWAFSGGGLFLSPCFSPATEKLRLFLRNPSGWKLS